MPDKKKIYWSTLAEYYEDPEVARLRGEEFYDKPESVFMQDEAPRIFSRRDFIKLGGAAAIFSLAACGSRPVEKIVPYVKQPEEITLGVPNYYASTCTGCPAACGLVIKTREGRPIKMEGNPDHPINRGRLCARGQAALLDLYDPARLRNPVKISADGVLNQISFTDADNEIVERLKGAKGQVVFLSGEWHGPARVDLANRFLKTFINAKHYKYEALYDDRYLKTRQDTFNSRNIPEYRFDNAEVVVLFGSDPFASGRNRVKYMRDFGEKRKVKDGSMSRVYAFEPAVSEIGANADERYRVKSSQLFLIAGAVLVQLVHLNKKLALPGGSLSDDITGKFDPSKVEKRLGLPYGLIGQIAHDLESNRGSSLLISESFSNQFENAENLHIIVHILNFILGNENCTIETTSFPDSRRTSGYAELKQLVDDMSSGRVAAIIIAGTNPAYSLPVSFGFAEALKKVSLRVSLSDRADETSRLCEYILPALHSTECWGDSEARRGLYGIQQPTITPLRDNRSVEDSLIAIAAGAGNNDLVNDSQPLEFYDFLRNHWNENIYKKNNIAGDFESFWVSVLQRGFFEKTYDEPILLKPGMLIISPEEILKNAKESKSELELTLTASSLHMDGRSMNNAWLLETPDPVSRITWDNYLVMAPARAKAMNLKEGDVVFLKAGGISLEVPVHIAPGTEKDSLTLAVGWGRISTGQVGNGVGVNAFRLAQCRSDRINFSFSDISIEKTDKNISLASVQGHNYIEHRPILYETTLEEFRQDPKSGQHEFNYSRESLWKQDHRYPGHKWGMVVDLNSCIGCNACITACQVENNIPVVGKDQVLRGREMHWIRIDRYYSGNEDNPDILHQPMVCHHCDKAPCETVCPVLATVHNDEGLNLQVYNRCVGTRYCSNNCPYKVRRFNYYDYSKQAYSEKPLQMLLNPDVTVRSRGVMEKCTFCIHRIRDAKHRAKSIGQPISDGDVLTACQQTCPTGAISFGDLNYNTSKVVEEAAQPRAFKALEELNIEPNLSFLTLVRNKKKKTDGLEEH